MSTRRKRPGVRCQSCGHVMSRLGGKPHCSRCAPSEDISYETRRLADVLEHPNKVYRYNVFEYRNSGVDSRWVRLVEENRVPWAIIDSWTCADAVLRTARVCMLTDDHDERERMWPERMDRKYMIDQVVELMVARNDPLPKDFAEVLGHLYDFRNDFAHNELRPVPDVIATGVRFLRKLQWDRAEIVVHDYAVLHRTLDRSAQLMMHLTERIEESHRIFTTHGRKDAERLRQMLPPEEGD